MEENKQVVYFHAREYAGPVRRMIAFILDQLTILFLLFAMMAGSAYPMPREVTDRLTATQDKAEKERIRQAYFALPAIKRRQANSLQFWLVAAVAYHIALRRTRAGTLGYRLAGIRLIDSCNEPPSWRVLFKRFGWGVVLGGPFGASFFLCLRDPKRQALHDRWCNTWMVRSGAAPAGPAMLVHRMQLISSWVVRYVDVEPANEARDPSETETEIRGSIPDPSHVISQTP